MNKETLVLRSMVMQEIEDRLPGLSREERLELIETVARSLRETAQESSESWEADLRAMAADPDMAREIKEIDQEFAVTLLDGLDAA